MRTVPSPAAPRSPSATADRSRPTVSSLTSPRRSRSAADTRSAADRSADRVRAGAARSASAARSSGSARTAGTRPTLPPRATAGAEQPSSTAAGIDDLLRDRGLVVAAIAAICAVFALALMSGVPAGAAVAIGFVPSLSGGWFVLTARADDPASAPGTARTVVALIVAHAVAAVPFALAILAAG